MKLGTRFSFAAIAVFLIGCSGGGGDGGAKSESDGLKQFFTPGATTSAELGPEGGEVSLGGDVRLSVPSLPKKLKVSLSRLDRKKDTAAPDPFSGSALVIVVEANADFAKLDPPAKLTVPFSAATTLAVTNRNGRWEPLPKEAAGEGLRVTIDHFSTTTNAFLQAAEWVVAGDVPPDWETQHRKAVEAADAQTKQFYGVGERSTRSTDEMCREFKSVLSRYLANPAAGATSVPADAPNTLSLANYLKHGDAPGIDAGRPEDKRAVNAYYWNKTAASMDVIRTRAKARGAKISAAELLGIAIDANGGNLPLGVLAAHNFLKDAAYQGRLQGDPKPEGAWTPADTTAKVGAGQAEVAGLMQPWRTKEAWSPKGRYDKLGPLYHIFATMTASTWSGSWFGSVAENGEAFLRYFGIGSDVYDPEKGAADTCGRTVGDWINKPEPIVFFQPVDGPLAVDKAVPLTLVLRGLKEQNGVTFRVAEGEAKIAKSVVQADPDKAAPECDKVGRELLCGNTVTPTKEGRIRIEAGYKDGVASVTLELAPPRSLTLVDQAITKGACVVDEGNVRAGSPFTQRCAYTINVTIQYSTDATPARIFCGIGPQSGETMVTAPSGTVTVNVRQFTILMQPGVGRPPISPSGCFLEAGGTTRATLTLQTILPAP